MLSVDNLAKEIENIPDLINAIAIAIQHPVGFLIVVAVIGWFLLNRDFTKIFRLFEYKEDRKLSLLDTYISVPDAADKAALSVAKEQRDTFYFKVATNGIYAEKKFRDALIALHMETSADINWTIIRRAIPYLVLPHCGKISVREQTKSEKFGKYYNIFVASLFALVAAGTMLLLIASSKVTFLTVLTTVSLALFFMLCALIVLTQNFPAIAAKKISKKLIQQNLGDINLTKTSS